MLVKQQLNIIIPCPVAHYSFYEEVIIKDMDNGQRMRSNMTSLALLATESNEPQLNYVESPMDI